MVVREKQKESLFSIVTYVFIFLMLFSINGDNGKDSVLNADYVFSAIYILLSSLIIFGSRKSIKEHSVISFFPLIFILLWLYGITLGIIKGNQFSFIVRNFAGMALYVLFYIFRRCKMSFEVLKNLLLSLSFFVVFLTFISYFFVYVLNMNGFRSGNQIITSSKAVLYSMREVSFVGFAYCLKRWLLDKKKFLSLIYCFFVYFVIFVCEKSGGDELALLSITFLIFILHFSYVLSKNKKIRLLIFFASSLSIVAILLLIPNSPLIKLFSFEDSGNAIRYKEIDYILNNFSIFGNGLGAVFDSRIGTKYAGGYAIEVIYLNIFHKFGILAILIIFMVVVSLFLCIKLIFDNPKSVNSVIPLSLLGYMISSIGNPMLFSPSNIVLHILAIILIDSLSTNKQHLKKIICFLNLNSFSMDN
jgi:hypothetical protein